MTDGAFTAVNFAALALSKKTCKRPYTQEYDLSAAQYIQFSIEGGCLLIMQYRFRCDVQVSLYSQYRAVVLSKKPGVRIFLENVESNYEIA